jgi:hypothetical protein
MEDILLQFPLTESLLAGVVVSVLISALRVYLQKGDDYSLPFYIPLVFTLVATMLFVESFPTWTWVSMQSFLLQFVIIFSFATLFWKTLGKSVIDKLLIWMKSKITDFTDKH